VDECEEDIAVLSEHGSVCEVGALVTSTLEVAQKGTYQGWHSYESFQSVMLVPAVFMGRPA
jgi:hypothetical protein